MLFTLLACQNLADKQISIGTDAFSYIHEDVEHFSLFDENETSAYYTQEVSTDQFPELISAWYFGHST